MNQENNKIIFNGVFSIFRLTLLGLFIFQIIQSLNVTVPFHYWQLTTIAFGLVFSYKIPLHALIYSFVFVILSGVFLIVGGFEDSVERIYQLFLSLAVLLPFFTILGKHSVSDFIHQLWDDSKSTQRILKYIYSNRLYRVLFVIFAALFIVLQFWYFNKNFSKNVFSIWFDFYGKYGLIYFLIMVAFVFIGFIKKHQHYLFFPVLFFFLISSFHFLHVRKKIRTQPVITYLNPKSGPIWTEVHIYGKNFGVSQYNGSEVYLNGIVHRVFRWENEEIVFEIDPNNSETGMVTIKNVDGKTSNKREFTFEPL